VRQRHDIRRVLTLAAGLAFLAGCGVAPGPAPADEVVPRPPQRIVSMAPSLTEVAFALGLGESMVGVTRYCDFPPEALELPKVGGYLDPAYEAIVALEPDLVLLIQDHDEVRRRLRGLGVATLQVDQHSVEAVISSIATIAGACGVPERGEALEREMRRRIEAVETATRALERPRVLVVVEREVGTGSVGSVWVAGPETFYDGVVRLAGGTNAFVGRGAAYPEVSREGLLLLDPDVILDLVADLEARDLDPLVLVADWTARGELRAVREGRVHLLTEGYEVIPGPRITRTVEEVARLLHPAAAWEIR